MQRFMMGRALYQPLLAQRQCGIGITGFVQLQCRFDLLRRLLIERPAGGRKQACQQIEQCHAQCVLAV